MSTLAVNKTENQQDINQELDPLNKTNEEKQEKCIKEDKKSIWNKINDIRDNITVEPLMLCFIVPSILSRMATQNLNLEKACRVNLGYSIEVCEALRLRQTANYLVEEQEVQKLTASVQAWRNILSTVIPCILILFVGGWSDKTGKRKPCMLIPIIGEFATALALMVNTYFMTELPVEVAALTEAIIPALAGGWNVMFVGAFSYVGDVTTAENRTYRVGVINLCMSFGIPCGAALGGVLVKLTGYYGVFSICAVLYFFGFTYGCIYLKESERAQRIAEENDKIKRPFMKEFFDLSYFKNTMTVFTNKGRKNRKIRIILVLLTVCIIYGPLHGEISIMYLFTRYRFNWDEVQYSIFTSYNLLVHLFGAFFSITVFSDIMKMDDALLGLISSLSKISGSFVYAFAKTPFHIYMAPLVEILNSTSFTALRSIASKLVETDELGKIFSLFGIAEAIVPVIYAPLYAQVYMLTLETLPGAFFLMGSAMTLPALFVYIYIYIKSKQESRLRDAEKQNEDLS